MPNQPPILNIQMVQPGVELVLYALSKLPFEQSAGLIGEIRSQAEQQLLRQAGAAVGQQVQTAASPADTDTAVGGTD
jgi:hypothetical protein